MRMKSSPPSEVAGRPRRWRCRRMGAGCHQQLEESGFACAVVAEQGEDAALRGWERGGVERGGAAVAAIEVVDFDGRRPRRLPWGDGIARGSKR